MDRERFESVSRESCNAASGVLRVEYGAGRLSRKETESLQIANLPWQSGLSFLDFVITEGWQGACRAPENRLEPPNVV